jgi:TM2 domain-containing membrane protein YozV
VVVRVHPRLGLADALLPDHDSPMATLLWIIAAVLVVLGIFRIVRGDILWGIVLIVVGLLVGPGGVSIFNV